MSNEITLAKASFNIVNQSFTGKSTWSADEIDKLEIESLEKYHAIIKQCRFFYLRDPIVSSVVNKLVEIGITKLIFDKGRLSENEFRIFEGIKDKLQDFAENCALEYLISGLVIPEINFGAVNKEDLMDLGIKKYTSLTLPVMMWLRDPSTVKIQPSIILDEPSYYVKIPDSLVFFIQNAGTYSDGNKDLDLYQKLITFYPDFIQKVKNGNKEILLENKLIVRRKKQSYTPFPIPYFYNIIESLKHKRNLRRMDYSIASRVISAIMLVKLGNDKFPVTEEEEDAFNDIKSQMAWRYTAGREIERIFQLFANHTLEIEWVFPPVEALLNEKKYAEVNADIFFGLGFPKILTTGETERTGSSDPEFASMSPVKTMENMQRQILPIIKGIIREVSQYNALKTYPGVRFNNINLHSFAIFANAIHQLYTTGNISRTSYADFFGYNWEEEMQQKTEEQTTLEKSDLPEFSPQPFSPPPGNNTE